MADNSINSDSPINSKKNIKIFSFFSGLGFLDLGFEEAGFNISFVNEINPEFLSAYKYARRKSNNLPEYGYSTRSVVEFLDDAIWKETFPQYKNDADCKGKNIIGFIGGPPCPDFSTGGKNKGHKGENGQLTDIYVKLIIKRAPDFFVLENVHGLVQTKKHNLFYERIKRRLDRAGYKLFDSIENALEYGVPQDRERLILVGFKRTTFGKKIVFDKNYVKQYSLSEILEKQWPVQDIFEEDGLIPQPENIIRELTVEYWFDNNNVLTHPNAVDIFNVKQEKKYRIIEEGNVSGKSFKRLHRWRYSPTAAYGNNEVHLHPYKKRRISVAEALALQSLPEDFEIPKELSLSAKFKMIGNGVSFLLAEGVALRLLEFIKQKINGEKV